MAIKTSYYGIKFPFTNINDECLFLDLNEDLNNKVVSEIAHVILTPKNTRIRMPDFGTDLIKYIFEYNDENMWELVKDEIKTNVKKYVEGVTINDVEVVMKEEDNSVYVNVDYSLLVGSVNMNNKIALKII